MNIKVAYRNLFRNRRRTLATGTAIVAGFVGLTLLGGYILRVQNSLKANTIYLNHHGHLSVYKHEGLQRFSIKPSKYHMTREEKEKLYLILDRHKGEIEFTGEALSGTGLISNGQKSIPFMATGIQPELEDRIRSHPQVLKWAKDFMVQNSGGSFAVEAQKNPLVISVTKKLGELLSRDFPFSDLSPEARSVQLAGRNYDNDLNAVNAELLVAHTTGVKMAEDTSLWAPIKMLQELYGTEGIHFLALYLRDESFANSLKKDLEKEFTEAGLALDIFSYDNEFVSPMYVGSMGFLRTMAGFFIFLICSAVALSIVNSLTMGILERTKELGTLRALGFESKDICWMFSQEAFLLTVLGILAGAFVATGVSLYINQLNIRFSPPGVASDVQFLLTPSLSWIALVSSMLMLVSVATGYLTSYFKMKAKVIDLLSDSGS